MFKEVNEHFEKTLGRFMGSEPLQHLSSGAVTKAEYASFLTQIYYLVRENPQLQTLATVYFRGRDRDFVRSFFGHATSEVGHDQLALNDIEALGFSTREIPYRNPLPACMALTSFAHYQITNLNPIAHLGYIFFLEFLPTQAGGALTEQLTSAGVPQNAMSFIRDHIEIDINHNRLMQTYVDRMITNRADFEAVCYSIDTTAHLYEGIVASAIKNANATINTGWNWQELKADELTPESLLNSEAGDAVALA